ncbi:MAG: HEPN domain-containing protein [Oscillospiraceae bacterium]|nr:HEPN domain-containing protein [Oscillospiraceae bacterium]
MSVDYDISKWIKIADNELSSAKHLFETHKPMPCEIVCFLSQQSAEKIIKGYLFSQNIEAPKTHDLEVLCDMCIEVEAGFNAFSRETATLSHYGVLPRYPNEIELTEQDAETALKYADKIMQFVKPLLPFQN